MFLWLLLLIIFAMFSYLTDIDKLPFSVFRHFLNLIALGFGIFLIVRTRLKQRIGYVEKLEDRLSDLASKYEGLKFSQLISKIEDLEKRVNQLEGKR